MDTPIFDFLKKYSHSDMSRFHMPGHKGKSFLGCESLDITEISGADSLYEADGIINESEHNASRIFGTGATFYSAEGSSLSIKAMIYSAMVSSEKKTKKIAAVRNVHKSFINACALLDIDIEWIYPSDYSTLCNGVVTPDEVEKVLTLNNEVFALYLTSPNYLGQLTDIEAVAAVCRKHNVPLLVDNAHGAYLKFCNLHPIDLGADMCCDSAHKTLPVLTGGAYLHISDKKKELYAPLIKNAMSAFGSTSPSYLIMASLDLCNRYLSERYETKLNQCINKIRKLKAELPGYFFYNAEPLKLTLSCDGNLLAKDLRENGIECEYADSTALVLMITPENTDEDFNRLKNALLRIAPQAPKEPPCIIQGQKVMSVREAFLSQSETIDVTDAIGRVCASSCISCPPAVPIAVSGEIITTEIAEIFKFYGKNTVNVIKSQ